MKKFLSILSFLFILSCLYANDAYFFMAAGQLVPTQENDVEVEMKEEIINIILEQKYYEVTVDFFFYNYGKTVSLEVGFPFFCVGISGEGTISDFKCWTNDVETSYTDYPIEKKWANDTQLENAYVRTVTFPSEEITKTRITYKSTYGAEAPSYLIAKYLYGTGSGWKNSIGKMTVRIQNKHKYNYPNFVSLPNNSKVKIINENTWEGVYTNIEPEKYNDTITITLGDIFGDDGPRIINKERFFGCHAELTPKSLFWYTKPQLKLLRNAIYAFNGYPFKSADLIELFEKGYADWGWYGYDENGYKTYPLDENFSEDKLTNLEKNNIKVILEEEKKR